MKHRTRIKFCGITSVNDALLAAKLGVNAIGLIFHESSPRHVSIADAAQISRMLPPFVSRVGVFVNENVDKLQLILDSVSLDILQFHGEEDPEFCQLFGKPYIKAIHIGEEQLTKDYNELYPNAIGFLLDTKVNNMPGGSGQVFNWQNIPNIHKPIILAGGLTASNVREAIATVKPYGVDVTSGIEKEKGVKDPVKMEQFIAQIWG